MWLFTVEGLADVINATAQGLRLDVVTQNQLGLAWLRSTYGVPAFTVVQLTVIALLLNHQNRERRARQRARDAGARAADVPSHLTASIS